MSSPEKAEEGPSRSPDTRPVSPEEWQQVEALFLRALDLAPAERVTLLERECSAPRVRAEVERLLAHDTAREDVLTGFALGDLLERADPLVGRSLGAYRLTERLASGGMGVVYRGDREDGLFDHEVAIKLIRSGRLDTAARRRFELERRALAALSHPDITRLYDGGTTDDGRPYLVMEFLDARPIDRWCDEHQASLEMRLELFARVCRAVHFAHQNLVVHRDLKPSNVLVDAQGNPKLLDFGIARFFDEGRHQTDPTVGAARAFTPAYAAPEQLTDGPVTTAIDIYALGVMLYELACGVQPFPGAREHPAAWHRAVVEEVPARPSARVNLTGSRNPQAALARAKKRSTRPATLRRRLAGDLDRITLMALRKEPSRRYSSAQALADDVERYLRSEPVVAREDSLLYRATKLVNRNRFVTTLVLTALGSLTWIGWTAHENAERAHLEAQHAAVEATSSAALSSFLIDTFLTAEVADDPERLEQARARLALYATFVRNEHARDDHLRANLLAGLARVSMELGLLDEAEPLLRDAFATRLASTDLDSLEVALSWQQLGRWHRLRGDLPDAHAAFEHALELQRTTPVGPHTDLASALNDLAVVERGLGDFEHAGTLHEEALALRRAQSPGSLVVAESLNNLALVHLDRGQPHMAKSLLEEALLIRMRALSRAHPLTLQVLTNLAIPLWQTGSTQEAIVQLEVAVDGFRQLHAAGREGLAQTLANLSAMQTLIGRFDDAEQHLDEAIAVNTARLGPEHPALASLFTKRAELTIRRGRPQAAEPSWQRALELLRSPDVAPLRLATTLFAYGQTLLNSGRASAAEAPLCEAAELLEREDSVDPALLGRARLELSRCAAELDRPEDARRLFAAGRAALASSPAHAGDVEAARDYLEAKGITVEVVR